MVKKIIQIGNPILTTKTKYVENIDSASTRQIVTDLLDTCNAKHNETAGLAAPQIGYDAQVCICRRVDLEETYGEGNVEAKDLWLVMINPKIIESSKETSTFWEACLSIGVGDNNLWGPVDRPKTVTITFTDINSQDQTLQADGYFSHVTQHELDHLNGNLFISYIDNPLNIWKLKDLDVYMNKHETYPPIEY